MSWKIFLLHYFKVIIIACPLSNFIHNFYLGDSSAWHWVITLKPATLGWNLNVTCIANVAMLLTWCESLAPCYKQWCSKYGPQNSSINLTSKWKSGFTQDLLKHKFWRKGPKIWLLANPPADSDAHWGLRFEV